jgi:hypothetical protein
MPQTILFKSIGTRRDAKVIVDPFAESFKSEMLKRGIWHVDADMAMRNHRKPAITVPMHSGIPRSSALCLKSSAARNLM